MRKSRQSPFSWLFRIRARYLVVMSATTYIVLGTALPQTLLDSPILAPFARLCAAAAPLMALLMLLPLPGALWRAWRERHLVRKLRSVDALRAMNWQQLEILMRRIFESQGYNAERVGGDGADGGVDIVLRRKGFRVLVQCKQWKTRQVAVGVVRELLGVISLEGADGGIVATCGVFTKDAREFARRANITLLDGMAILALAEGVRLAPVGCAGHFTSAEPEDRRACPLCGGQLVRRFAKSGARRGSAFLGCANFPTCKGTRTL